MSDDRTSTITRRSLDRLPSSAGTAHAVSTCITMGLGERGSRGTLLHDFYSRSFLFYYLDIEYMNLEHFALVTSQFYAISNKYGILLAALNS